MNYLKAITCAVVVSDTNTCQTSDTSLLEVSMFISIRCG